MYISRIYDDIGKHLKPGKALILYGPRQVGKTTLLKRFLKRTEYKYRFDSGENIRLQEVFSGGDFERIGDYVAGYDLIVLDEAQKIPRIGEGLKILVDQFPAARVLATGSSSFELAGQVGEPLTGRKITLTLYPVAQMELAASLQPFDLKEKLEQFLVYGSYPEVLAAETAGDRRRAVMEIADSYLLRDILAFDKVKNSKLLLDLLRLLAFQLGNEVSLSELGRGLGLDYKTVARYLDILEKSFVIYNLRGFSRNLRKEITKKSKYYFYDVGIRNAVISSFNSMDLRDDAGALWENFLVMERVKMQAYSGMAANNYFWRTWDGQEVDFVEERGGVLHGYEFKWGRNAASEPKDWKKAYPRTVFNIVDRDNYLEFCGGGPLVV